MARGVWYDRVDGSDGVERLFDEYDEETLERVWKSLFKRKYNQVWRVLGGNDFKVEHTGTDTRQSQGKLQSIST